MWKYHQSKIITATINSLICSLSSFGGISSILLLSFLELRNSANLHLCVSLKECYWFFGEVEQVVSIQWMLTGCTLALPISIRYNETQIPYDRNHKWFHQYKVTKTTQFCQIWSTMSTINPAKYEVLIKEHLRSILDISELDHAGWLSRLRYSVSLTCRLMLYRTNYSEKIQHFP